MRDLTAVVYSTCACTSSFEMYSYYEGIQHACLRASPTNAEDLEVAKCSAVLDSTSSWKVDKGHIKYGNKCLFHMAALDSAAKLKACDESSDSFISVIPYRSSPYGSVPYAYPFPGLTNIFPTR